jgi:glycosyltransferase involved in cell wall biosynthesis
MQRLRYDFGMDKTAGILVPAFNEASALARTVSELVNEGFFVVCVDDGSTDTTAQIAGLNGAKVLRHAINLGQGAAIETGFEYFRRSPKSLDCVVTFDADGQHDVKDIHRMVSAMRDNHINVILGTRFIGDEFQGGFIKRILLKLSAKMAKYTIRLQITDRHNGLRCLDMHALRSIRLRDAGFGHADELLTLIKENQLTYTEVPVQIRYTDYSFSKGQPLFNLLTILFDRFFRRS